MTSDNVQRIQGFADRLEKELKNPDKVMDGRNAFFQLKGFISATDSDEVTE